MQTFSMSCHCRKVDGEIFLDNLAQSLLAAKQSHPEALYVLKNRRFLALSAADISCTSTLMTRLNLKPCSFKDSLLWDSVCNQV